MTMPQASHPTVLAHCAEAQEAPAMSCQVHTLVVVMCPVLSTGGGGAAPSRAFASEGLLELDIETIAKERGIEQACQQKEEL
jgi:hypothetical protein